MDLGIASAQPSGVTVKTYLVICAIGHILSTGATQ